MHLPQLLDAPVVCGAVLQVLYLDGHDGAGAGRRGGIVCVIVFVTVSRQQVGRQRAVHGVCEQGELKLHLEGREMTVWSGCFGS